HGRRLVEERRAGRAGRRDPAGVVQPVRNRGTDPTPGRGAPIVSACWVGRGGAAPGVLVRGPAGPRNCASALVTSALIRRGLSGRDARRDRALDSVRTSGSPGHAGVADVVPPGTGAFAPRGPHPGQG